MRKKPYIIAEACCNHMGDFEIALKMIEVAAESNINAIKFQKRNPKECLSEEQYNAPHPCEMNSFGASYGLHREYLEFTIEQHKKLQEECKKRGIEYSASVWDLTSAKEVSTLNPTYIKIPSAANLNMKMLAWLCENYDGEIQISLGMTTRSEEKEIFDLFCKYGREKDLIFLSCTSGYPTASEEVCLLEISRLKELYGNQIKGVGFSGHQLSKNIDIAAYMLGAEYIERHFTLDRRWKGTDQSASLVAEDFVMLNEAFSDIVLALQYKECDMLPIEMEQRRKMKDK